MGNVRKAAQRWDNTLADVSTIYVTVPSSVRIHWILSLYLCRSLCVCMLVVDIHYALPRWQ